MNNEPRSLSAKKFSRGGSVPLFLVLLAYHDRLLNRPSPPLPSPPLHFDRRSPFSANNDFSLPSLPLLNSKSILVFL